MIRRNVPPIALAIVMFSSLLLAACGGGGASVTRSEATGVGPATVYVNNTSNESFYYIYMSPTSQSTWGPDLLGSSTLSVGQSFMISNIGEGYWDIKVVDSSGNTKEVRDLWAGAGGVYDWFIDAYDWY